MNDSDRQVPPLPMGQIRWRCRRGMRELDILLTRFLEHRWDGLPAHLQTGFVELLEVQDPILMDWIMGRATPETPEFVTLIDSIRTPVHD